MRQTLRNFGYNLSKIPFLCDNESAICLVDNPIKHNRTKHIDIWHHFLRDHQQIGDIDIYHVSTDHRIADIFTRPLNERRCCELRSELNVLDLWNLYWSIAYIIYVPLIILIMFLIWFVAYFGAQVVECLSQTLQVLVHWCIREGEDMLILDPLRLMCLLKWFWCSLKGGLKEKMWIWTEEDASTGERYHCVCS
jgi:hypothetical protein